GALEDVRRRPGQCPVGNDRLHRVPRDEQRIRGSPGRWDPASRHRADAERPAIVRRGRCGHGLVGGRGQHRAARLSAEHAGPGPVSGRRRRGAVAELLAPAELLLVLFFVIPSADLFRLSLAHMDAQRAIHHDLSLVNYRNFATNPYFHRMVWGSMKLTVAVTALCLFLGYPAAYSMVRARSRLSRTVLYAIVVSPLLISVIVRSYGGVVLLAHIGVINGTLLSLGLIERPLRMLGTFGSVIVATVHVLLPFMMLPIASALQTLDAVLERAAQSLGASPWQTFWRVTLPLSMPGVVAGTSLVIALTLGIYITPLLVAGAPPPPFAPGVYYVTPTHLDLPPRAPPPLPPPPLPPPALPPPP